MHHLSQSVDINHDLELVRADRSKQTRNPSGKGPCRTIQPAIEQDECQDDCLQGSLHRMQGKAYSLNLSTNAENNVTSLAKELTSAIREPWVRQSLNKLVRILASKIQSLQTEVATVQSLAIQNKQ